MSLLRRSRWARNPILSTSNGRKPRHRIDRFSLRRCAMLKANDECLDLIFRKARTHTVWLDKPVDDALLRQVYDLAKMGPTSANMCPLRMVFVKSRAAKEKLKPALDAGNVDKTMKAPVTAILALDTHF